MGADKPLLTVKAKQEILQLGSSGRAGPCSDICQLILPGTVCSALNALEHLVLGNFTQRDDTEVWEAGKEFALLSRAGRGTKHNT